MWPFRRREARAAADYTDVLAALLLARAEGTEIDPGATAALETAAGLVARAFSVATVSPSTTRTACLSASVLGCIGRELIRRGEAVFVLGVDGGRVQALPASHWEVRGGRTPDSWWYRLDMPAPDETGTITAPGAGVLHFRFASDPRRPLGGHRAALVGIQYGQALRRSRASTGRRSVRPVRACHSDPGRPD